MLDLSTEMYNNEQVSKVFRQNFSWNMPIPKISKSWEVLLPYPLASGGWGLRQQNPV